MVLWGKCGVRDREMANGHNLACRAKGSDFFKRRPLQPQGCKKCRRLLLHFLLSFQAPLANFRNQTLLPCRLDCSGCANFYVVFLCIIFY